jgi:hypothetical protein
MHAVRSLHSGGPTSHPGLYLLEIAAALLSVLALRDAILRGALPSIEALSAAALWGALFVAVYCLTPREAGPQDEKNGSAGPL